MKRVLITKKMSAKGPFDYPTTTVGKTAHVTVLCATALGPQGITLGKQVLANAENDWGQILMLFGGINLPKVTVLISPLSTSNDGSGGAYHYGCNGTVLYADADFSNAARTSALFIAELSEVAQAVQAYGWDCGASPGEGLSRAHAELLYPGALDDYETASAWLDSVRADWVNTSNPTDQDDLSNGCSVLFLNWLFALGFTWPDITQAGGATLAATYKILTQLSKTTAWQDFNAAVNQRWPIGRPSGVTVDNPWSNQPPSPTGSTITLNEDLPAGTYTLLPQQARKK